MTQIAVFDWRNRHSVRKPEVDSFPTRSGIASLRFFEHAIRLESLILEGDFELTPILQVLARANSVLSQTQALGLSRLRRLTLRTISTKEETFSVNFLLQVCRLLEDCTLETRALLADNELPDSHSSADDLAPSHLKLQRLRSLDLNIRSLTRKGLTRLLGQCPQLERLKVIDYGTTYISEGFGELLQTSCPALKSLILVAHGHEVQGQELVQALMRFPRLCHLGIESIRWGDQGLIALQEHCPTIQSLDIGMSSGWKIRSQTLQRFLIASRGLKHLKIRGLRLAVEDMVDTETGMSLVEWGCTGLETLSIGFSRVGQRRSLLARSQDQQLPTTSQIIYSQLSKLTQLKTLELLVPILPTQLRGSPVRGASKKEPAERDFVMLGSLQQLQHLRILGTGQGSMLTEGQFKWMIQAWPKLENIVIPTGDHSRRQQFETWIKQGVYSELDRLSNLPSIACQCCQ
ncbi:hypothetical protein BGZ73_008152 [Actinomortierella ambigua]|nr:hypothetical protein BGZ73_008152 [Actinomortierella ambigua]